MSDKKPSDKKQMTTEEKASKVKADKEFGGFEDQGLPEPTRYNDWEVKGRCSDF